jgi:hypothetical protein
LLVIEAFMAFIMEVLELIEIVTMSVIFKEWAIIKATVAKVVVVSLKQVASLVSLAIRNI